MADREKVLKGLQCLAQTKEPTSNPCKDCEYIDRPNFAMCVVDVAIDALELLKEQEAVKPKIDAFGHPYCPKCKVLVYQTWSFCPYCGQAVKWE